MPLPTDWFPDWSGDIVVLVASGPSAPQVRLAAARGKAKFIAVNNSWRLAPWSDVLYSCDFSWWNAYDDWHQFAGLKVSIEYRTSEKWPEIRRMECQKINDFVDFSPDARIGWGGNSGFGAINLAVKFGAKRLILVGYDMTLSHGPHWHGKHKVGMHNPLPANVRRWRRAIDNAEPSLKAHGVRILNASPISGLEAYPKIGFEEALKTFLEEETDVRCVAG